MKKWITFFALLGILLNILSWKVASGAAVFRDSLGRAVELKKAPKRVVSLAPSLTEILYYLGLGERVAGVTQYSYYPPAANHKPKVGSYNNLNVERIIGLNPDLVVGTVDGNEPGTVKVLDKAGIPVYIVNPRKVRDAIETIATLGHLCGVKGRAQLLADSLRRRVDSVFMKTAPLKRTLVFLQINLRPIITVNKDTIHNDVIWLAGGRNMTENEPITYPRISIEEVIRRGPEVIIISSMGRGDHFVEAREAWMKWTSIPAVRRGRVHLVDSDLLDRPSPRIVAGLEIMARLLHPEVGWEGKN